MMAARANVGGAHAVTGSIDPRAHPRCVVCGASNALGLQLRFVERKDGVVESSFECRDDYEGYPGQLHGGVIAMLLDGVMTNCLFATGRVAVTAELGIRYLHPVRTNVPALVRARVERARTRLQIVVAELIQDGKVKARASAKFLEASKPRSPQAPKPKAPSVNG